MSISQRLRQANFPGKDVSFAYRFARRYLQQVGRTFHLAKPAYRTWAADFIKFCQGDVFARGKPPLTSQEAVQLTDMFIRSPRE